MEKKWKVKIHPSVREDIAKIPDEDKLEIMEELSKIKNVDDLMARSKPLDMEKMKEEEPEVYATLMKRVKEIKNDKEI